MIKLENIILASKSAIRQKLLKNAGIKFTPIASNLDEETAKFGMREMGLSPAEQAFELAKMKAQKISIGNDNLVIGCDQILNFENQAFDKVDDISAAKLKIKLLQGKTHYLEGALVIMRSGQMIWRFDSKAELTMHPLSDEMIDEYIATAGAQILHSVGCYELEGIGAQLFSKIKGDYFAILGLPIIELLSYLRQYEQSL